MDEKIITSPAENGQYDWSKHEKPKMAVMMIIMVAAKLEKRLNSSKLKEKKMLHI